MDRQAFPIQENDSRGDHYQTHFGMSIRQFYKAAALQGILVATADPSSDPDPEDFKICADLCAKFADAMCEEDEENAKSQNGSMVRLPCVRCGEKAHAHHEDYSKPLDVIWLCHQHHMQHHQIAMLAEDESHEKGKIK